jgi:hypothetical protein
MPQRGELVHGWLLHHLSKLGSATCCTLVDHVTRHRHVTTLVTASRHSLFKTYSTLCLFSAHHKHDGDVVRGRERKWNQLQNSDATNRSAMLNRVTSAGENLVNDLSHAAEESVKDLSNAGEGLWNELNHLSSASVSVWRSAVHTVFLPPPAQNISGQEAALRLFLGGLNFGILCFPYAFRMAGMVNGFFFVLIIGLINNYTSKLLVHTHRKMLVEAGHTISTLPDLAHALYGNFGASAVGSLMFACQFGFCVSHCVFIGISMSALLKEADASSPWIHSLGHYEVYVAFLCAWGIGQCSPWSSFDEGKNKVEGGESGYSGMTRKQGARQGVKRMSTRTERGEHWTTCVRGGQRSLRGR